MRARQSTHKQFVALGICMLCGCGESGAYSKPTAHLSGAVTVHEMPLPADAVATIVFMPNGGGGQAHPVSVPIEEGKYDAAGVPQGQVLVLFDITRPTGRMIREDGGNPFEEHENLVPVEAQQGIEIEVTGDAVRDFTL
jgi:hypothetical protein